MIWMYDIYSTGSVVQSLESGVQYSGTEYKSVVTSFERPAATSFFREGMSSAFPPTTECMRLRHKIQK